MIIFYFCYLINLKKTHWSLFPPVFELLFFLHIFDLMYITKPKRHPNQTPPPHTHASVRTERPLQPHTTSNRSGRTNKNPSLFTNCLFAALRNFRDKHADNVCGEQTWYCRPDSAKRTPNITPPSTHPRYCKYSWEKNNQAVWAEPVKHTRPSMLITSQSTFLDLRYHDAMGCSGGVVSRAGVLYYGARRGRSMTRRDSGVRLTHHIPWCNAIQSTSG